MSFLNALKAKLNLNTFPFNHWLLDKPLSPEMIGEIATALAPVQQEYFDGTRATDGGAGRFRKGIKTSISGKIRLYLTLDNIDDFPALSGLVNNLRCKEVARRIGAIIKRDLSNAYVRIEIIVDTDGFWLKPHCDISEKLMSSIIFANENGEPENLGTDLYNEDLKRVKTLPYITNSGYVFASGFNTWHGLEKKKFTMSGDVCRLTM